MAGFGDLVQKAFYMGVGLASYAGERAGSTLSELRSQAQKLADELVERGELTTEEAKRMVDDMVNRAQQSPSPSSTASPPAEPRRIEILTDDEEPAPSPPPSGTDSLRDQIQQLQDELRRLKNE